MFTDVTAHAGVAGDSEWHTSAMFVDYDNDGKLDLFVCSYCDWTPENDIYFSQGGLKSYGTPDGYYGLTDHLYHNNGNGTFTDVTRKAGIYNPKGKTMSLTMCDVNGDGYPDIFVACDLAKNMLYRNNGNGTFTDIAERAGVAAGPEGKTRSGMGIDCADLDNDGLPSIVIGNFFNEPIWVYKERKDNTFVDLAMTDGIGEASLPVLKFGVVAADFDHDGFLDVLAADGEVHTESEFVNSKAKFKEPMQLYRNLGHGKFEEIVPRLHGPLQKNILGRGIALGDLFNTGNMDALVTTNDSTAMLLRNDTKNGNTYLEVRLHGVRANRDGIGARITAICPGWRQSQFIHSGSSYESASQSIANFGLGKIPRVDTLIVKWNARSIDTLTDIPAGQAISVTESTRAFQIFPRSDDAWYVAHVLALVPFAADDRRRVACRVRRRVFRRREQIGIRTHRSRLDGNSTRRHRVHRHHCAGGSHVEALQRRVRGGVLP